MEISISTIMTLIYSRSILWPCFPPYSGHFEIPLGLDFGVELLNQYIQPVSTTIPIIIILIFIFILRFFEVCTHFHLNIQFSHCSIYEMHRVHKNSFILIWMHTYAVFCYAYIIIRSWDAWLKASLIHFSLLQMLFNQL